MHLLALTKRSAFYTEEKRHIEERHISPVHLIVLHLPAKEVTAERQLPSTLSKEGLSRPSCHGLTWRFRLQHVRQGR